MNIDLTPGISPEQFNRYLQAFSRQKNLEYMRRKARKEAQEKGREQMRQFAQISRLPAPQKEEVLNTPPAPAPWLVYQAPFDFLPSPLPEGLIVWREWNVCNGYLISPAQQYLWKGPSMRANEVPKATNSTGLYSFAFNPILGIHLNGGHYSEDCRGLCECLGETVIHEDGRVRSAELKILCLFGKGEESCANLAGRYHIPAIPRISGELLGPTWKTFIRDQYIEFMKNHPVP